KLADTEATINHTQLADFLRKSEYTVTEEFYDYLKTNFDKLFDFPIEVPEISILDIGGQLTIITEEEVTKQDLNFYDLTLEYQQLNGDSKVFKYHWGRSESTLDNNTINFDFTTNNPILSNNIIGFITVKVKGYDGAILWEEKYDKENEVLSDLDIKINKYPTGTISVDPESGKPVSNK